MECRLDGFRFSDAALCRLMQIIGNEMHGIGNGNRHEQRRNDGRDDIDFIAQQHQQSIRPDHRQHYNDYGQRQQ